MDIDSLDEDMGVQRDFSLDFDEIDTDFEIVPDLRFPCLLNLTRSYHLFSSFVIGQFYLYCSQRS